MASNTNQQASKPKSKPPNNRQVQQPFKQFFRKPPPRAPQKGNRQNIYINTKTDFKVQLKRCEELLNSGVKEIYLHCLGYAITTGINLALQLVVRGCGAFDYAVNTSTVHLIDELHPMSDASDISLRPRNNSALHIKVFNKNTATTETATQEQQPPPQQQQPKTTASGSEQQQTPQQQQQPHQNRQRRRQNRNQPK